MNTEEARWRQRFQNFSRAYQQLDMAVRNFENLSVLEKEGLIQRFEYTFELAWKTLKDYLTYQSVTASFPRDVIKAAFQYELIEDGELWMDMLEKRNLLAHAYAEEHFLMAVNLIKDYYFAAISQLYIDLGEKI